MPRVKNKKTGKWYNVTEAELKRIQSDPGLARGFEIRQTSVPDEVKKLITQKENSDVEQSGSSVGS